MSSQSIPPPDVGAGPVPPDAVPPPTPPPPAPSCGPPAALLPPMDPLMGFALRQAAAAPNLVERIGWYAVATRERRLAETATAAYMASPRPNRELEVLDRIGNILGLGYRFWQEHAEYRARALHEARCVAEAEAEARTGGLKH